MYFINIINLTPHEISIFDKDGNIVKFPTSDIVARVDFQTVKLPNINNFEVSYVEYGEPIFVNGSNEIVREPEKEQNTIYIVSALFYNRYPRGDFYKIGQAVRDEDGKIIGCIGLSK